MDEDKITEEKVDRARPEKIQKRISCPHEAVIKMQIVVRSVTEDGSINPNPISRDKLNKYGLDNYAVLCVRGYDMVDCLKNVKTKLEKLNG